MSNICIYHASCADGFGAALAVKIYFDKNKKLCEFVPCHHGSNPPDVKGKNVYIVDFSYPREVLLKMKKDAKSLLVLDHHKSAEEALKGLDFCQFDMNRSGAMMAWNHFHPEGNVPQLIQFIQDRDLWLWNMDYSKEFSAGLSLIPMEFPLWEELLQDHKCWELVDEGRIILRYQNTQVLRATNQDKIKMINLCGHDVPILNTTTLISEICGKLAEDHPFAVTYFDTQDDRIYSLRSRGDDGEDVSEIAKKFGGGGHRNASGFSIPINKKQL